MQKPKFILTNKKTGETNLYKSITDISKVLEIDYHQARAIYIHDTKGKKHKFNITEKLCEYYEIKDNPDYLNVIKK